MGYLPNTTNINAELRGLVAGLELAYHHGLKPLEVTVDVEEVIGSFREENIVADCLTKQGSKTEAAVELLVFDITPSFAFDLMEADRLGLTTKRAILQRRSFCAPKPRMYPLVEEDACFVAPTSFRSSCPEYFM